MKSLSLQASLLGVMASSSSAFTTPSVFGGARTNPSVSVDNYHDTSKGYTALFSRRGERQYQPVIKIPKPPMNLEIDPIEVRVTLPNPPGKDEPLGVMHRDEALAKAKELGGLDLVLVNPSSDPPVCKIVDYSKYRYSQEKKAKEVKKNSKASEIKEVKMSYKIDVHDYDVRKKSALKFLNQGNRVKCTVMFRGREVQHDQLGFELLDRLAADLDVVCLREGRAKREGKNLSLIISPRPEVLKRVGENRRAEEKARKKKKAEQKQLKAAAIANGEVVEDDDEEDDDDDDDDDDYMDDDDDLDLEGDIESSLDDLFGSDGVADELFG